MKTPLLLLLRAYKLGVSPFLGQNCRFYPSCSDYAAEAVKLHGAFRGSLLAARRLGKCHPWHPGGLDPVPGTGADEGTTSSAMTAAPAAQSSPSSHPPSSPSQPSAVRVHSTVADGCSHP